MTRGRIAFVVISALVVVSLLSGALVGAQPAAEESSDSFYKYLSVFSEVLRLVRQSYVDETDLRTLMAGALEGSSDALDPFSMYIPESELEDYLEAREIGWSRSGVQLVKVRGAVYAMSVVDNGPAAGAGLQRGDIVTKLRGLSTHGMPQWEIEQRLAAAEGTRVALEILRAGETSEIEMVLGSFDPPGAKVETVGGTPLLTIPSFEPGDAVRVASLVSSLDGEELVVDLRGVTLGDAAAAYDVARLFVKGEMGTLQGREGPLRHFSSDNDPWQGRIVVLIDRSSQGPAEVLAKVLRQGAGAILVGQQSFGFAGHPKFVELDAGGSLLLTDGFYTGPDGEPLNEGIEPDHRVSERRRFGGDDEDDDSDPILERALEVLRSQDSEELEEAA